MRLARLPSDEGWVNGVQPLGGKEPFSEMSWGRCTAERGEKWKGKRAAKSQDILKASLANYIRDQALGT